MDAKDFSNRISSLSAECLQVLVDYPVLRELIEELVRTIESQQREIDKLRHEVKRLQDQLNLDSHNSSKPPSSDYGKLKKTKSLKKSSGKKVGG